MENDDVPSTSLSNILQYMFESLSPHGPRVCSLPGTTPSFPPSEAFDNFLAQFLKECAPSDRKEKIIFSLYAVIYSGARSTTPAINEIPSIVASFFDRPVNKRFESNDFISQVTLFLHAYSSNDQMCPNFNPKRTPCSLSKRTSTFTSELETLYQTPTRTPTTAPTPTSRRVSPSSAG